MKSLKKNYGFILKFFQTVGIYRKTIKTNLFINGYQQGFKQVIDRK